MPARGGIRLQRFLSRAGIASRRAGERLIEQGRVSVDGVIVTELGTRVVPDRQIVRVDGRPVAERRLRWLLMNKPAGYLTTRRDDRGRPTVYQLLPRGRRDLSYVGRLDFETEGALLFTNDGEAAHRLTHPSHRVPRRYVVEVEGAPTDAAIQRLEKGIVLEDGPARVEDITVRRPGRRRRGIVSEIELTIREGRKREVRRLMEALGYRVQKLMRRSFGPIDIEGLAPGETRELSGLEIEALWAAVGLKGSDGDS